jgi:hypothetical protein
MHTKKGTEYVGMKRTKVLQIEPNTTYRKYKESAHMSLLGHPISEPSLDIPLIWTPVVTAEVKEHTHKPSLSLSLYTTTT